VSVQGNLQANTEQRTERSATADCIEGPRACRVVGFVWRDLDQVIRGRLARTASVSARSGRCVGRLSVTAVKAPSTWNEPSRNDGLHWPRRDGLKWLHLASVVVGVDVA
jgi:hypothetical protein